MPQERREIPIDGRAADALLFTPAGAGSWPLVVMYMDAAGLRPEFSALGERLAGLGYLVLQPNLYWRTGPHAPFDPKVMFSDPGERARVMGLMKAVQPAEVASDTAAWMHSLGAERAGLVGYCMGGRQAFIVAQKLSDAIVATAPIHPGGLVTDAPDSPHLGVAAIRARIYVGAADEDNSFTHAHQETLGTALSAVHARYEIELHRGARHGFAMPDFPVFDRTASERHWEKITALFEATLR